MALNKQRDEVAGEKLKGPSLMSRVEYEGNPHKVVENNSQMCRSKAEEIKKRFKHYSAESKEKNKTKNGTTTSISNQPFDDGRIQKVPHQINGLRECLSHKEHLVKQHVQLTWRHLFSNLNLFTVLPNQILLSFHYAIINCFKNDNCLKEFTSCTSIR